MKKFIGWVVISLPFIIILAVPILIRGWIMGGSVDLGAIAFVILFLYAVKWALVD